MLGTLEQAYQSLARHIAGQKPTCYQELGGWIYPPTNEVFVGMGFLPIAECIVRRQGKVANYVATRPLLKLCIGAE